MKDKQGKTIEAGQRVVTYTQKYSGIKVGTITGFTPKRVYVKLGNLAPQLRAPCEVVIL